MVALFLALAPGCKEDDSDRGNEPISTDFLLYLDYWNPTGQNPSISFNEADSSPEIKIDFSKTFDAEIVPPNIVDVVIDNLRIIDTLGQNYEVDDIIAYEWRENKWEEEVEFEVTSSLQKDLACYLVLDASTSLGDDFANIQQYAISFVNEIFSAVPDARLGVIHFNEFAYPFELTGDQQAIIDYINSIEQKSNTALYDAMNLAITELQNSDAESRAIVTFTDGKDNISDINLNADVLTDLLENDPSGAKVISYTIGLRGDNNAVDVEELEQLATNGGVASFPVNLAELENTFDLFSRSVATVYELRYRRNQQPVLETDKRSLKFEFQTTAQE